MKMSEEDCIFCNIARGKSSEKFVKESDNFVAFLDVNPVSEGHTLVVPKKHFVTLLDIPNTLGNEMLKMVKDVASGLLDEKKGDGFNLIMNNLECAGQVVKHAHVHVVPRKDGDGVRI